MTKTEIFWKIWLKSKFFENFDQNRIVSKILPKPKFSKKKMEFFENFYQIAIFFENFTQIEIFRNFRKDGNFSKILTKIEIF